MVVLVMVLVMMMVVVVTFEPCRSQAGLENFQKHLEGKEWNISRLF